VAWTRVQTFSQNAEFTGTFNASTQVTLGSAVAVGDTILLETTVGADPTGLTTSTVTDQLGNSYIRLSAAQGGQLYDSGNTQGTDAWWCIVTSAGTPTVTYTPGGGSKQWMGLKGSHFTGSDPSSTRRDSKGALQTNPGTGANAITTASVGASSGDLLWAGSGRPGNPGTTEAAGSGFTGSTIDATTSMIDEWKTAAGAGAATFTDATGGGANVYMTYAIAITPASGADTTAPVLTAQTVSSITSSGGTPAVTTDEGNGTVYMVIVPDADSPSVAQIKAGLNSSGGAALANQNQAVSGTGVQGFSAVGGLSASTAYDCWFVHTDAASNNSTAVKADFTTSAGGGGGSIGAVAMNSYRQRRAK
jgi:hypothetical protein